MAVCRTSGCVLNTLLAAEELDTGKSCVVDTGTTFRMNVRGASSLTGDDAPIDNVLVLKLVSVG